VVGELVRVQRSTHQRANKAPRTADEASKWLDWPNYLRLVEALARECAPLTHKGMPRSDKDVAMVGQRHPNHKTQDEKATSVTLARLPWTRCSLS